ncbi:glutamate 5-kinase [Luteococcus sanguinis]|uniref:Glutamate 5-kinase n=1 Tax=Luteococcus sanguinis TaxID=174038 RepID=A0ABW1X0W4_9ACTN
MSREAIRHAERIVVKVGSSSLTTAEGGIDPARVQRLVDAVADVRARGCQVVLISSGAIAAGLAPLGFTKRPRDLASQQAAASVGQGLLINEYTQRFGQHGFRVGQVLLTVDDLTRQASYRNALRTFARLLKLQAIPIVNENDTVATHEIRFGDNDRLAALVAQQIRADALVLLSDVDALYSAHPSEPGAERIGVVADINALEVDTHRAGTGIGTGGMTTKLQAARIATSAGIPVVLAAASEARAAVQGQDVGTWFEATGKRRPRRLLWLAHASHSRGRLVLDAGAVRAVTERKASLLAAGVTSIDGDFVAGDPVDLVTAEGRVIARGLVGFSSEELPAMLGRNSHDLAESLGVQYEREVVHRDVLVLLTRPRRPRVASVGQKD